MHHLRLVDFFPFFSWIRGYGKRHVKADLVAGLTVAVVAVPQSMAYALIAGLPVQYGLYASIVPAIVGSLWGSSAHLITGPTTATSLVVFSIIAGLAQPGSSDYFQMTFLLALMAGGLRLAMGLARLGNLLNFVSHSVILGFTAGAGVLIAFNQLPSLFGLQLEKSSIFVKSFLDTISHLDETHVITLILGITTTAIILLVKRFRPTWPGTLLALITVGSIVAVFRLDGSGVAVVGTLPRTLPPVHLPGISRGVEIGNLAPGALAIALLGLMEAVSSAKAIAGRTHQQLNINQEFIGQGFANVAASMFSGYPVSGSFTRSALNFRTGGKTPMSGVFSGIAVAVVLLIAAPLAAVLPVAALAGVLVVVAYEMVDKEGIMRAVRTSRADGSVLLVTFLSTLFLQVEFAIYVGVLLSIGLHLAETSHPRIHSVVPDLSTGKMVGSARGKICCQMDVVTVEGAVFFGSVTFVLEDLQRRLKNHPYMANLLIRLHQVNVLDASGIHVLEVLLEEVRERGGGLYFAGVKPRIFQVFKNSGLLREVGESHFRSATGSAIRQAMRESFCPAVCATCEYIIFVECAELKRGNWEIFGEGVLPRQCKTPRAKDGG
ncbi:MAG: SulP family inorganic anion transporter [Deltaproteobacteria bacterium]|nr:SulP family inorganic anion transporter [Deltaproteobacteria bacterium]